jgi:hypothetical protein
MGSDMVRADALSAAIPLGLLVAGALTLLALWIGSHFFLARIKAGSGRLSRLLPIGIRVLIGVLASWAVLQVAARFLILATDWSLWFCAAVAALAIEGVVLLYGIERRTVSRLVGRALLALRLAAVALLVFLLLQPVLAHFAMRGVDRTVAVLMDGSASMHTKDLNLSTSEKLAVADLFGAKAAADRYKLGSVVRDLNEVSGRLNEEHAALQMSAGNTPEQAKTALAEHKKAITDLADMAKATLSFDADHIEAAWKDKDRFDPPTRTALEQVRRVVREETPKEISELANLMGKSGGVDDMGLSAALLTHLKSGAEQLREAAQRLPDVQTAGDELLYKNLNETARKEIDAASARSRAAVVRQVLTSSRRGKNILGRLQDKYVVKMADFASRSVDVDVNDWLGEAAKKTATNAQPDDSAVTTQAFRQGTDMSGALESLGDEVSPESLSGVLFLSDGLHNAPAGVEAIARKLGAQGVPIVTIMVGGTQAPKDASVLKVEVPESVYLGDKVAIRADLKLDGLRGQKVNVKLVHENGTVDDESVDVPEDSFRTSVRFTHTPAREGTFAYRVEIEPVPDETIAENNTWGFDVAVSNDRTDLLLIENRPRWEYRYLRNLFFGRDKSVSLQHVLLTPDSIEGLPPLRDVAASATREFGDSEATRLPENRDEWMKFDVIALGDVPPSALDDKTLDLIRECVVKRGAMLIVIAGPRHMPHAYASEALKELLPVQYQYGTEQQFASPEPAFRLRLSPDGREHSTMQLSDSPSESQQIWESLPPLFWRHAIVSAKEGATVLAYAEPERSGDAPALAPAAAPGAPARQPAEELAMIRKNALIAAHRVGQGRVLMLTFDGSWRLRYRVGDTYHHRFWGQALRWGAFESLRAGNEFVRLGTDKITYKPDEPVHVIAKVNTPERLPVNDDRVFVNVYLGEKQVLRKVLDYRQDSNGMYETMLKPLTDPGKYRIELQGGKVQEILGQTKMDKVQTEVMVSAESPLELAELVANPDVPAKLAGLSSGAVLGIDEAERVMSLFGPGSEAVKERRDTPLWDSWILLLLVLACVGAEWIVRKNRGLP